MVDLQTQKNTSTSRLNAKKKKKKSWAGRRPPEPRLELRPGRTQLNITRVLKGYYSHSRIHLHFPSLYIFSLGVTSVDFQTNLWGIFQFSPFSGTHLIFQFTPFPKSLAKGEREEVCWKVGEGGRRPFQNSSPFSLSLSNSSSLRWGSNLNI